MSNSRVMSSNVEDVEDASAGIMELKAFTRKDSREIVTIYLPQPGTLQFSDGASFSTTNLGSMGLAGTEIINGAKESGATGAVDAITKQFSKSNAVDASVAAVDKLSGGNASWGKGTIINPNTQTTFAGNTMRQFSFTYVLAASSEEQVSMIKDVVDTFRANIYAEPGTSDSTAFFLRYPPIWTIKFLLASTYKENLNLPRLYSCYLNSVATTYNGAAGRVYFKDGAPVDINLSLSFQESRILNKKDVDMLSGGGNLNINSFSSTMSGG